MRVAVIDIGTNSTRLLVAEGPGLDGAPPLRELERHSRVTGLGRGVDTSGLLSSEAIERVCAAVADYLEIAGRHEPERTAALATSAVRDASNGSAFLAELRERFALNATVIAGEEEARLTYLGATAARANENETLVCDIGGGSTELVVGTGPDVRFHESLQLGVVRHSERFLSTDPPTPAELDVLAAAAGRELEAARERHPGPPPATAIAVAGTATSLASIELDLVPYDAASVEGHILTLEGLQHHLSRLASISLLERERVRGLQPDRAATIVCGVVILIATMRAFELEQVAVSEHDILWGAALDAEP